MRASLRLALALTTLPLAGTARHQDACATPEHRQFDFWIGEWSVTTADGRPAGRNTIVSVLGGCVLQEQWVGVGGLTGSSFNLYDGAARAWHQTWVDSRGQLLLLEGGLEGSTMVLRGERPARDGGRILHRITWEPLSDARVRQVWSQSRDAGATWRTVFDGVYERVR